MTVLLTPNLDKTNARECTQMVIERLYQLEINIVISDEYREIIDAPASYFMEFDKALICCDIILAIGGDGTIIHSSKRAVEADKPLLGINVGRLGFMAGIEMNELDTLKSLKTHDYTIESRMMLECVHYNGLMTTRYLALNDVVVSNGALSRIIELDISCDNRKIVTYRADGIIISTPTGSTAYALSAGGPVLEPSIDCISLTPICPHSLLNRTVIFKESNLLTVRGSSLNLHPIYITIDGEEGAKLLNGDYIEVSASKKHVQIIKLKNRSFYEVLSDKFLLNKDIK